MILNYNKFTLKQQMSKKKKINIHCHWPTWLPCGETSVSRWVTSIPFFPVVVYVYSWSSLFMRIHLVPKICGLQISTHSAFKAICQTCAKRRKFESPNAHCRRIYWARQTLLSSFSSHKQVSFWQSCLVPRFHIFVLFVGNAVVKNGSQV